VRDAATVRFCDELTEVEAEPLARAGRDRSLVEDREDRVGHGRAVISDREAEVIAFRPQGKLDPAAVSHVADRVRDEILEQPPEEHAIGRGHGRLGVRFQEDPARGG
jgi:hypothetical protein